MFNPFNKKVKTEEVKEIDADIKKQGEPIKKPEFDLDKEISIHVMPEYFRSSRADSHKEKKMGLFVLVLGSLVFLGVSAFLFIYLFANKEKQAVVIPEDNRETVAVVEPEPIKDELKTLERAKETYLSIKREFNSLDINDPRSLISVIELWKKNLSETVLNQTNNSSQTNTVIDTNNVFALIPAFLNNASSTPKLTDQLMQMMSLFKEPAAEKIKEIQGELTNDTVTLFAKTDEQEGKVQMVFENDLWKLFSESWINKATSTATSTPVEEVLNPAKDTDADGISDSEETALGTKLDSADSDGDSYSDLTETMNLYDPSVYASGRLIDNPNIKQFVNKAFNYSFIYPTSWLLEKVGGDDSVILKTGTEGQIIQIMAQPNADKEDISAWFARQFGTSVEESKLISGPGWQGIKKDNGLIVYAADNNKNYIFSLSYSPGNNILEFHNIFNVIVKSFAVTE